jgi:hypothetical protein
MDTSQRSMQQGTTPPHSANGASRRPLLGIGLPVYNGAEHLREAIDSLLAQDVGDFELVISDNASTDETAQICLGYAARDPRVRYSRNDTNTGAAANFNRAFDLSCGKYFMWGSDDDIWDPRFARLCIQRLEKSPRAVLCASDVTLIGAEGQLRADVHYDAIDTAGMSVEARVHELVRRFAWYGTYAVIRPEALRATRLNLPIFGMDVVLFLELLLLGEALVVPEALFTYRVRDVPGTPQEQLATLVPDSEVSGRIEQLTHPWSVLVRGLLDTVASSTLDKPTIRRIEDDFVDTLSLENLPLGGAILDEHGVAVEASASRAAMKAALRTALSLDRTSQPNDSDMAMQDCWGMRDSIRLRAVRKTLLRLLQPFTDRQRDLDVRHEESLVQLRQEVNWLRRRVTDLERFQSRQSDEP